MPPKPTRAELEAALDKVLPDIIAPHLRVLFCGINPGSYSAAIGHHFARPGNRFWPALYASGFTDRLFTPDEDRELLKLSYGLTNIVTRTTATAKALSNGELIAGAQRLKQQVQMHQPRVLAILGINAYRTAFQRPQAVLGLQIERLDDTILWVLPNPSGLNAHYTLPNLAIQFRELLTFTTNLH